MREEQKDKREGESGRTRKVEKVHEYRDNERFREEDVKPMNSDCVCP